MSLKFKISVVIPIYNVQSYLKATILSVVNQSLDFKKNIQLVLVNDGSPDDSEKICLDFKKKYPDNVIYIKQKNAGVSAARNNGMQYATGEYINFLDADDKWSKEALQKILKFFDKNKERIDFVSCRMKHFDKSNDYHSLDAKFTGDYVCDVLDTFHKLQLHITSTVLKTSVAKKYKFNEELKYGEDALYLNTILLDKLKYGVFSSELFYYRLRKDCSSAIQTKTNNLDWFTKTPELFYNSLIKQSIKKYKQVLPYIQNLVAYDLQWRTKEEFPEKFEEYRKPYLDKLRELLFYVSDSVIADQQFINFEQKKMLFDIKYNKNTEDDFAIKYKKLFFNNIFLLNLQYNGFVTIKIMDVTNEKIIIYGEIPQILTPEYAEFKIFYGKTSEKLKLKTNPLKTVHCITGKDQGKYYFKCEIPLATENVGFYLIYKKLYRVSLVPDFARYAKLSRDMKSSYYVYKNYLFRPTESGFSIKELKDEKKLEKTYLKELWKLGLKKTAILRLFAKMYKKLAHKKIWLVYDKFYRADDNAEYFFKYLMQNKDKNRKVYFVLSKTSDDYGRLKKIGKVIQPLSRKHKILHFCAEKIISSHATENIMNPLGNRIKYFKDMISKNFFFLQHGIITHDQSRSFNNLDKDLAMFVTSTKSEYDSILENDYMYDDSCVKLTGLPRYDRLFNYRKIKSDNVIVILPTWRKELTETYNKNYESVYSKNFKKSNFFKFYNGLITDPRILDALKKNNYKLKMCLHPIMKEQWRDFTPSENVIVNEGYVNYSDFLQKACMLITDYSSIAWDFAYVVKPVIYTHFDEEEFFQTHAYQKDEKHFKDIELGPVCNDYESTVATIIKYIENKCKLTKEYNEKINNFFYYHDNKNCERVLKEILSITSD